MLTAGNAHALTWILSTASAMDLECRARRRCMSATTDLKEALLSVADAYNLYCFEH